MNEHKLKKWSKDTSDSQIKQGQQKEEINGRPNNNMAASQLLQQQQVIGNRVVVQLLKQSVGQAVDQPIQMMKFNRFSGKYSNWGFYSNKENALLKKEKEVTDFINSIKPTEHREYQDVVDQLRKELTAIQTNTYSEVDYDIVMGKLGGIYDKLNQVRSKITYWEHIRDNFNSKSAPVPNRATMVDDMARLSASMRLYNLPELRELLDVLVQFVNDALIKSHDEEHIKTKDIITKASVAIQRAFLEIAIKQDSVAAETRLILGCILLQQLDTTKLKQLLSDPTVKPKQRESGWRIDAASMMLAASSNRDGFQPDLVVGLPTAGSHVASRIAAASGIMTGKQPVVWNTRAHAVKEDSKTMMQGVTEDDYFKPAEKNYLIKTMLDRLQGSESKEISIFIVDDGLVSGNTLAKTYELYQKVFRDAGFFVTIRTGVARGNSYQSRNEVIRPDYIVEPRHDWGGRSRAMESVPDEARKDPGSGYEMDDQWNNKVDLTVDLVWNEAQFIKKEKVKIEDLLNPPKVVPLTQPDPVSLAMLYGTGNSSTSRQGGVSQDYSDSYIS